MLCIWHIYSIHGLHVVLHDVRNLSCVYWALSLVRLALNFCCVCLLLHFQFCLGHGCTSVESKHSGRVWALHLLPSGICLLEGLGIRPPSTLLGYKESGAHVPIPASCYARIMVHPGYVFVSGIAGSWSCTFSSFQGADSSFAAPSGLPRAGPRSPFHSQAISFS